jgi:hypothetical protein
MRRGRSSGKPRSGGFLRAPAAAGGTAVSPEAREPHGGVPRVREEGEVNSRMRARLIVRT